MLNIHEDINKLILKYAADSDNIGLLNGKLGISIYLFRLSQKLANPLYREYAEALLDDVYQNIDASRSTMDFENGFAGIAWGIEYLVQNDFVDADTDEVLADLDDKIFQYLNNQKEFSIGIQNGIIGYGFYLISRLQKKKLDDTKGRDFLLARLLTDIINRLYEMVEEKEDVLKEPVAFNITWVLPLSLFLLAEIKKLKIYDRKVDIILSRLSPIILSTFPVRHSSKFYLSMGINKILQQVKIENWRKHKNLIGQSMNLDQLDKEFSDKNITLIHGYSGLGLLLSLYQPKEYQFEKLSSGVINKILQSTIWEEIKNKKSFQAKDLGLLNGISGIGYSMLNSTSIEKKLTNQD